MARVLIVEDEETDRIILGNIVERAGHQVRFASDRWEALKTYVKRAIDVVVTDLHMPDGDGLDFITASQALLPEAAIIAVSGKGPELLAAARSQGVLVALSKPVDSDQLLDAIAEAAPDDDSPVRGQGSS